MFLHVTDMRYVDEYRLWLRFSDGVEGVVDLLPDLYGEIFEPLRDLDLFRRVYLTGRTIEWPNGADFAPEYLRQQVMQIAGVR
jgi:hypothetical protein